MSDEKKRLGRPPNLERQKLLHFPGRSKREIKRMCEGKTVDYAPRIYEDLRTWDIWGTLATGYEGHFPGPDEAIDWWLANAVKYCDEQYAEYQADNGAHPGRRSNLFWELSYAISFPCVPDQLLLLEAHDLWYPGEREKLISQGVEIPEVKHCDRHDHGFPIEFAVSPMLWIIDGQITRLGFDECEAVKMIWDITI